MSSQLKTGNGAAALGAKLARADYIPAFPITPQTEIIETLSSWVEKKEMDARITMLESEHSMITAAGAAAAAGARVFTATSSQGLLYGMEMVFAVSGWRVPFVLVNVSRGLASPLTLESDHTDILSARDSGFLQIFCSNAQEVLDSILIAYRLAEHPEIRLPVFVNLDGFVLSFTRESVSVPSQEDADKYLPSFDPGPGAFRSSHPVTHAAAALNGSLYSYFRYETHLASLRAASVYEPIAQEYEHLTGRLHPAVEEYRNADAEVSFVLMGAYAEKAKGAVEILRGRGIRAGLVRPRLFRPFPVRHIIGALGGKKAAIIVDQNLSMGKGGILHTETASALYGHPSAPMLAGFIGGLGGRDISTEEFIAMADETLGALKKGRAPETRLLYTEQELRELRRLQTIAHAEKVQS